MSECDCGEKVILVSGDVFSIARETFCYKHGYENSCYMCNENNHTTDICQKHREQLAVEKTIKIAQTKASESTQLLIVIAQSLENEALKLNKRDVGRPNLGKKYSWNLRSNILRDISRVLKSISDQYSNTYTGDD